jgi:GTP-binding protein
LVAKENFFRHGMFRKGIQLEAPPCISLERAIEYIDIDEYVEATPQSLRLRKRILGATTRKRAAAAA